MLIHDIIPNKKKMKQIKKARSKPLNGFSVSNCHPERVERVEKSRVYARKITRWLHCGKNSPLERGKGVLMWSLFAKRLCIIFSEITRGSTALTGLLSQRHSQRNKRKLTASALAFLLILQTIIGIFTPINVSVTPPYISPQETKAAGFWTVGFGGDSWSGNVTHTNTTEVQATGKVELRQLVDDYVSYWRFDGNTTVDENTTSGNDGTNYGATYIESGKYGGAFNFNGASDYISTTYYPPSNAKTMMYWGKWTSLGDYDASGVNDGANHRFYFGTSYGNVYAGLGANSFAAGLSDINTDTWYLYTLTVNDTNGDIYRDTTYLTTFTYTQTGTSTLPIFIGALNTGTGASNFQNVAIDDFRVYNRALTSDEIAQIYNNSHETSGTLTSISKDAETIAAGDIWKQISFTGTVSSPTTTVNLEVDSSDDDSDWIGWTTVQNSASSSTIYNIPSTHQKRYGKYRLTLNTTNTSQTPEIQSVVFISGNVVPNAPVLISPSDSTNTSDNTPTLSANYSDSDAGDVGTTNYRISSLSLSDCTSDSGIAFSGTSDQTITNNETTEWTSSALMTDQTYYWCARNDDGVSQSAWTAMGNFVLDTATPDIVAIDAGASSADRISLASDTWFKYTDTGSDDQISFQWTDPVSISDDTFYYELNSDSGNTITGDESTTIDPYIDDITITEGTNYFHTKPKNGSGAWGTERIFIVKYDKTDPTVSLSSPANDTSTGENQPTLTWSASDATSGIAKYQLYIDSVLDTDNISNSATSVVIANELTCGSHTWYIRAYDNVNNYTDSSSFNLNMACGGGLPPSASNPPAQPEPNSENPEGKFSVLINSGDEYTNSEIVTLKLYAGIDTTRMAISNTSDFKYASQVSFQEEMQWDLSSGRNEAVPRSYGANTVYAKFYTQYGVASETVSDSVILKTADTEEQTDDSNQDKPESETEDPESSKDAESDKTNPSQSSLVIFTQTLQFGSNNNQVIQLQNKLKELNFFPKEIISNGNFGPTTEQAIKEYQASKGIYPCGIVGPRTRKALNNEEFITNKDYQFTQDLKYNDKNEEVLQLQTRLQDQNFFPYQTKPTGYFGSITQKAVNLFQKFYNLIQGGIVDEGMREVLN